MPTKISWIFAYPGGVAQYLWSGGCVRGVVFALVTALVLVVAGSPVPAGAREIRVGVLLAPKQRSPYEAIFARFTEETGIRVRSINLPNAEYKSAMPSWLLEGKDTPDVLFWNASQRLFYYADKEALLPITDVWDREKMDDYFSHVRSTVAWKNEIYGLPVSYYHWGIYYRKSVLAPFGGPPTSWEAFLRLCQELQASGITPIGLGARYHWPAAAWFDYLDLRLNGLQFHQKVLTGKISFNDPKVQKVLSEWKKLIDSKFFNADSANLDWNEVLPFFYRKQVAFVLIGNFISTTLPPQLLPDIGFMPFPRMSNAVASFEEAPLDVLIIPKKARNVNEAKRFIQFMARADIQSQLNESLGFLPPNKSSTTGQEPLIKAGAELLKNAKGVAQFFDRDTTPAFEIRAIPLLAAFVLHGNAKELTLQLEQARVEIFGRK